MDDLTAAATMLLVSEMAEHGRAMTTEHDLRVRWEKTPGYDISRDVWLIVAPDGQLAAMIGVGHRDAERMYASPRVHPDYADLGLYDVLIELGVERARELTVEAQEGARVTFNVFCAEKNAEFHQALERAAFKHVRSDWTMQIDMDAPPPEPTWPEGVELRPYTPAMLYAIYEADNEAFRDHWGHLPVQFEAWQTWTVKREGFDPSLWFLAYEGDEIAAFALCEYEQSEGWIGELGVRRPWRRKGLGLALLYQAFGEFYRRGISRVSLNVDSQNLTGATRLYRRAGMRPVEQRDMYELELRAGVELSTATLAI
jgi:mycothiol synthase